MQSRHLLALLSSTLLACAPTSSITSTGPASARYVVRVTSGETEGVAVDWAFFPEDAWPVEGRRDDSPFLIGLPEARVALLIRPKLPGREIEVTILQRKPDGTLGRLQTIGPIPLAVVSLDHSGGVPVLLAPADTGLLVRVPR
ncbi:MAG: hypothetical protein ABI587_01910 [Gemmatimonadales bacterium]